MEERRRLLKKEGVGRDLKPQLNVSRQEGGKEGQRAIGWTLGSLAARMYPANSSHRIIESRST